ncbi:MAG TPA: hypothetical protein DCE42_09155 [Myxococcales bacterium]|nr:hypothetical protein [Deltaproteobacteria bacterium]HAA54913.1 hypothetical protein [Myxococcales bacterium]
MKEIHDIEVGHKARPYEKKQHRHREQDPNLRKKTTSTSNTRPESPKKQHRHRIQGPALRKNSTPTSNTKPAPTKKNNDDIEYKARPFEKTQCLGRIQGPNLRKNATPHLHFQMYPDDTFCRGNIWKPVDVVALVVQALVWNFK